MANQYLTEVSFWQSTSIIRPGRVDDDQFALGREMTPADNCIVYVVVSERIANNQQVLSLS